MSNSEVLEKVNSGYRMSKPRAAPEKIYQLMLLCWSQKPEDRPTFDVIFKSLTHIKNDFASDYN